ncbi:MAG TPA: carboxypeptidase-like regulatory domain-containing protein, partial [Blastocatellia bacterium]|nr:carboxypeptidase-like regulatory domain-containing protein [Blastocatellia bacterium]
RLVDGITNRPIPGARVAYERADYSYDGVTANANGEFHLKGLSPGTYSVYISDHSGSEYTSDQVTFDITDRDITGLEIRGRPAASISGSVVVEGSPAPGLSLDLSDLVLGVTLISGGIGVPAKVETDGRFRISGIRPGKYMFRLHGTYTGRKGFSFLRVERDGVPQPNAIDVGSEPLSGLRVVIGYGTGVIRGRVDMVGGVLPESAQLSSVTVTPTSPINRDVRFFGELDSRRQFVIEGVPAGDYRIAIQVYIPPPPAQTQGWRQVFSQTVSVVDGASSQVTLTIDLSKIGK